MRIGLAQINSTLGDFAGNRQKILQFAQEALTQGCDLVVFPELTLMGYLPNDLLERASVVDEQLKEFKILQKGLPKSISILVGLVTKSPSGKSFFNSAALLSRGAKPKFFHKQLLPTYDVFDEARHHQAGETAKNTFRFKGQKILLTICEDIWGWALPGRPTAYLKNPLKDLRGAGIDLVLNMSASPFTYEKIGDRKNVVTQTAKLFRAPVVYVNMVGGQDEIIFDGGSFAVDRQGKVLAQGPCFVENLNVLDLDQKKAEIHKLERDKITRIRGALVLGIRDFIQKTGFQKVHLGLSGGIDSAVVACLAVEALGKENVVGFTLPGPYNQVISQTLAEKLAAALGIRSLNLPIAPAYEVMLETLRKGLGAFDFGLVNENLQARLRGVFLMAYSNKENSILLSTGNKSELATGFSTLYGDMCGGLAPIADLLKNEVYALAQNFNLERELIPELIITRPPSAELRPNQTDQDFLPPYEDLDASVRDLVEFSKPARSQTDQWLLPHLMRTEFKRWQSPPILKVSRHAFGRGRRFPIAHKSLF